MAGAVIAHRALQGAAPTNGLLRLLAMTLRVAYLGSGPIKFLA
jgi:hypothetical protein